MEPKDKKKVVIWFDKSIITEVKIYAAETDTTINEVLKEPIEVFNQAVYKLVSQIHQMREKSQLEKLRKEEELRIASEVPLIVSGHEVPAF